VPENVSFAKFLRSFKSGWGAAVAVVTAGPLALFGAGFSPPWPTEGGVASAAIATVGGIVGLVLAHLDGATDNKWKIRSAISLILSVLLLLGFVAIWSLTVVQIPQTVNGVSEIRSFVTGFSTLDSYSDIPARKAIKDYGIDVAFSPISLVIGRMSLLMTWVLMFMSLNYGFGLHQINDSRQFPAPDEEI